MTDRETIEMVQGEGTLAQDVRRESGLEFSARMGLNSGEVVVGRIGDDLRMDYTAQGHVVGLAARVQQLAPPGGITVTEQTARLAAGLFDFLDRGEQRVKGASTPVRVFELRGTGQIRSRLESSRARGFSRFVGRQRELARLEEALRAAQSGRPTVVLVTAEPGAGKGRLCHEFVERAHGVALHYARALSHGRMLPFHVIAAVARSLCGVGEGNRSAMTLELAEARRHRVPTFTHFLDLPILFVIVALGAARPNTWTLFVVATVLGVGTATLLTLAIPRMYPFSVDPGSSASASSGDRGRSESR